MPDSETNREVVIEKLVYGGSGLARDGGRVVLVPFVLPGESVRVGEETERRGVIEARLDEVLSPGAGRTEPPCPFFFRCGGCHYQHATYEVQLEQKVAILREALRRVGKMEAPEHVRVLSGEPLGYRNRTQFHLAAGEIGYFGFASHRLVPVDHCPISSPKVNEALTALRDMRTQRRFPDFVSSIEVFTNESDVQLNVLEAAQPVSRRFFDWCAERIPGYTEDAVDYTVGEVTYRVRHRSFFQVNRYLLGLMVETALEGAGGAKALDLYSGVGLFSIPLARRFGEVTAVETSGSAALDLEFNAQRAGAHVAVRHQAVEAYLEHLPERPDFVLADPPRAGLGKYAVRHLLRLKPERLTIVACDPATLARDLAVLVAGGYRLDALTLVDLFPQTYHIETVARLSLGS
ncbi:MAG TPA: class I SAM-dependent RNA methyltransferase [Bryobacteraceae bacterium]